MSEVLPYETRSNDGKKIETQRSTGRVLFTSITAGEEHHIDRTLPQHPVRKLIVDWLTDTAPGGSASSLEKRLGSATHFLTFLREVQRDRATAEAFPLFLTWLRSLTHDNRPLREATRRGHAGAVLDFYRWLADESSEISVSQLNLIEARCSQAFRGFGERQRLFREEFGESVSSDDLRRLYNAIRVELERIEKLLREGDDAALRKDRAGPLLPFLLLLGIDQAMRSGELNALTLADVRRRPDHVFVHQPNKRSAFLFMCEEVQRAWVAAEQCQARYRTDMDQPHAPALMLRGNVHASSSSDGLVPLNSVRIRRALRVFYREAFETAGADGNPLLYTTDADGTQIPFFLPFHHFRHAAITEYARYESDPSMLRIFARHEWLSTTESYVRRRRDEVRDVVAGTLGPMAERVRLRVRARQATPDEVAIATEKQANVPGGVCGEALSGITACRRANDCRVCKHFLIDPRKQDWFEQDSKWRLSRIVELEDEYGYLREAQNHRGIVALNDAIIQAIDEWRTLGAKV